MQSKRARRQSGPRFLSDQLILSQSAESSPSSFSMFAWAFWSSRKAGLIGSMGIAIALGSGQPFNLPMVIFLAGAVLYQWIVALIVR